MQMLVFLNFPLYSTFQGARFVTERLMTMEFLPSGFSSAFSSVDRCGALTCGGLGASWQHVGQSYGETSVVLKLCSINFSVVLIVT